MMANLQGQSVAGQLIDGKAIGQAIREQLKEEVATFQRERGVTPGLAVVRVGEDPASRTYVQRKQKACAQAGIHSEEHHLPESTSQDALLATVTRLNQDPRIHGILVQLPLPDHLDEAPVIQAVDPSKDVDGLHPVNVGQLWLGEPRVLPCTPAGIIELIRRTGTEITGKHAVVLGRSNIVGKPVAALLLQEHATVTLCHSRTMDLPAVCRQADILIAAVGRTRLVRGDWIRPGAVVIDVGINRTDDGKLVGDVDFEAARTVAGHITPVPGGVGPMTIAMLLRNTLAAARQQGSRS